MTSYLELFCGVVALLIAFYYYRISYYDFWKRRGVVGPKPHPFFCNLWQLTLAKTSFADVVMEIYKKYKHEPVVGLFDGITPVLVVHDPDLIKNVLIKDFPYFQERTHPRHERTEPMTLGLFHLDADRWRVLRSKTTPLFTGKKLKDMFGLIVECSNCLEEYVHNVVEIGESIDVVQLASEYTTNVIGSCIFGINTDASNEDASGFRQMVKHMRNVSTASTLRLKMSTNFSALYNLLGYIVPEKTITQFFTKIVMNITTHRKKHGIYRPDFINMLMKFKERPEWFEGIELTDTFLAAQAFTLFVGGQETSSIIMSWALYEIALNHEIQDKLRAEIHAYHDKYGDTFTVDSLKEMKYLDKVFKETLRKFPFGGAILRKTLADYTFDALKLTIPKETNIWIPNFALQKDPDIYPDPEKFDPERFNEEQLATRPSMYYLPFGEGPRNCLGSRFANLQTKLGMMKILRNYKVDVCEKTMIPYQLEHRRLFIGPKGSIDLKITKNQ